MNIIESEKIKERLNNLYDRLKAPNLLNSQGIGNELGFYIFDYPPESELIVREHLEILIEQLRNGHVRVKLVDLFELAISILRKRSLLKQAEKFQIEKGDEYLQKALKPIFNEENFAKSFLDLADAEKNDLILVNGVGSVFPLVRSHTLLSNLHSQMRDTPLVLFYPGQYDGEVLRLFNKLESKGYYRAFQLT